MGGAFTLEAGKALEPVPVAEGREPLAPTDTEGTSAVVSLRASELLAEEELCESMVGGALYLLAAALPTGLGQGAAPEEPGCAGCAGCKVTSLLGEPRPGMALTATLGTLADDAVSSPDLVSPCNI